MSYKPELINAVRKAKFIEVNATKGELYWDWGKGKNKFGLIKNNEKDKKKKETNH